MIVTRADSGPKIQSFADGSGIILFCSSSTTGSTDATLQLAGPLGVIARVGCTLGLTVDVFVGISVDVGARVRVGFPFVGLGVIVGIGEPKSDWQADRMKTQSKTRIKPVLFMINFISLHFPVFAAQIPVNPFAPVWDRWRH
jgi:hypothetical protein